MGRLLPNAKPYSVVILIGDPTSKKTQRCGDHLGARSAQLGLRDDGVLAVVLPVTDGSDVCGIGVFAAALDDTIAIMNDDSGVAAGVFTYEVHPCRGFPGDSLP